MRLPSFPSRIRRHVRLSRRARGRPPLGTPPFLTLFINSTCNLTCEHCFYWKELNQKDDLTFDEIARLSEDLGPIENLNLSGGEPFIRKEAGEIVRLFIRNNGVKQVYIPTNGYYTERTVRALRIMLEEKDLDLLVCEISLDGMPEYHDKFRGNPKSFGKAMETYEAMAAIQAEDPRLRIHATSTANDRNVEEIRELTDHLARRCPAMDYHDLAVLRGDYPNASLRPPPAAEYHALEQHVRRVWEARNPARLGSVVDPMMQWAKKRALREERQAVPCRGGILTGVVYANGDVGVCEMHDPIGNLRQASFREIWASAVADARRARIAARECWCTHEITLWPSIVFQPASLARAFVGSRAWRNVLPSRRVASRPAPRVASR